MKVTIPDDDNDGVNDDEDAFPFDPTRYKPTKYDVNGDGKSDIFWRNRDTGMNFVYLMEGANIKERYVLNFVTAGTWQQEGTSFI